MMKGRLPNPGSSTLVAAAGFATFLGVTALCQHPEREFDRLREYDPVGGAIPNWRFFAPEPAQSDFHVVHRLLMADGTATPWMITTSVTKRAWSHFFWFPDRRREKAMFDICVDLGKLMARRHKKITLTYPYLTLRDFVARKIREERSDLNCIDGFQFAIVSYPGFEEEHDPSYLLVSPLIVLAGRRPREAAVT